MSDTSKGDSNTGSKVAIGLGIAGVLWLAARYFWQTKTQDDLPPVKAKVAVTPPAAAPVYPPEVIKPGLTKYLTFSSANLLTVLDKMPVGSYAPITRAESFTKARTIDNPDQFATHEAIEPEVLSPTVSKASTDTASPDENISVKEPFSPPESPPPFAGSPERFLESTVSSAAGYVLDSRIQAPSAANFALDAGSPPSSEAVCDLEEKNNPENDATKDSDANFTALVALLETFSPKELQDFFQELPADQQALLLSKLEEYADLEEPELTTDLDDGLKVVATPKSEDEEQRIMHDIKKYQEQAVTIFKRMKDELVYIELLRVCEYLDVVLTSFTPEVRDYAKQNYSQVSAEGIAYHAVNARLIQSFKGYIGKIVGDMQNIVQILQEELVALQAFEARIAKSLTNWAVQKEGHVPQYIKRLIQANQQIIKQEQQMLVTFNLLKANIYALAKDCALLATNDADKIQPLYDKAIALVYKLGALQEDLGMKNLLGIAKQLKKQQLPAEANFISAAAVDVEKQLSAAVEVWSIEIDKIFTAIIPDKPTMPEQEPNSTGSTTRRSRPR